VEPTRNKRRIKNARGILSTDESDDVILNIIGSIKIMIIKTLIDYIEGVTVWEKLELEFTCKDFLMDGFK
jgi:hypothetical protein